MTRLVKTTDDMYDFIERFADRYDSYESEVTTDGIIVTLYNKEG